MRKCSIIIISLLLCNAGLAQEIKWAEGRTLTVEGKAGKGQRDHFYDRLPGSAKKEARQELWDLAQHSAGLCIRFSTDSPNIHARWTLRFDTNMPHLTCCVTNGIDLYALDEQSGKWLWAGLVKPYKKSDNSGAILKNLPKEMRHYMLYLPMYNGIDSVFIGTDSDAQLLSFERNSKHKPVVFYGTSIMQGASASRCGLAATAILGRFFNVETINLGFSGNARMESVIGDVMTSMDASCYVVDCLPNMTLAMINERAATFIKQLKTVKPHIPIILVECSPNEAGWLDQSEETRINEKNKAFYAIYQELLANGYTDIYYVPNTTLIGNDREATIDGTHYNDLGFVRYSECLKSVLGKILSER
ncbi:MAG: SGNH/GDSL hydrolase family protein [Prevotellaceae bacterium]|jgi:lysophospholipase L1-like esterase|nr:SGNH/GDSL hydrolase family protein [Prevotellaceae bacterium]